MRYRNTWILLLGTAVLLAAGCGRTAEKENSAESSAPTASADSVVGETADSQTEEAVGAESLFPESYSGGTEKITFACSLEIPDEFDPDQFYLPKINGLYYIDRDKAYETYVEGEPIQESEAYATDDKNVTEEFYVMEEGGQVVIDSGLNYSKKASYVYANLMPSNDMGVSQEEFPFASSEDCIDDLKTRMTDLSYPIDEFKISWFSINAQEYQALEQAAIESEYITAEEKKESWTEEDDTYVIYGWQTYGGLQVFPQVMLTKTNRAFESYQRAPLSATYTAQGVLDILAQAPYRFESTEEKASFASFDEVADAVIERYDNILDDVTYRVDRAMLIIRTYFDESQKYEAGPVWYFEVSGDSGSQDVVIVDAQTGKEIYLAP